MPILKLLGGLGRRTHGRQQQIEARTVGDALSAAPLPRELLFPAQALNPDIEVLVNGRNIHFLAGVDTELAADDRVTIFLHGARGYPGG